MKNVKVIGRLFSEFAAQVEKRQQLKIAAVAGNDNVEVVICDAYASYMGSAWFKSKIVKIGRPVPGQKIVVVYYNVAAAQVENISNPKSIDMIKPVKKTIEFKVVKPAAKLSLRAAKEKAILIELACINNTHLVCGSSKLIRFRPSYNLGLAS